MEYYVGATIVSMLIAWGIKKVFGFEKHKMLKMLISLLPLTVISAFRYNVGWDYGSYSEAYSNYIVFGDLYFDEVGFKAIVRLLASFTDDPTVLFAFFSLMTSVFFSLCFKYYGSNKHAVQYILLFFMTRFFFCSLNIMRQALAMVMSVYAFHFIIRERTKWNYAKFVVIILLAASIHKLALIFIPLSFILTVDFKKLLSNVGLLLGIVAVLAVLVVFLVNSGYLAYFYSMFGNDGSMAVSELCICVLILTLGGLNYAKLVESKQNILFYNLEIIGLIACLASPFIPTPDRIIWYFVAVPSIFLIPQIINKYNRKLLLIPAFMIYLFLGIVVYNQAIATDSYDIVPYESVLNVDGFGVGV